MRKMSKSEIMALAWTIYRRRFPIGVCRPSNEASRRAAFSQALKSAWMTAAYRVKEAAKTVVERAVDMLADRRLAALSVDAKSFRYSIRDERIAA
jgi:hypothetical protein